MSGQIVIVTGTGTGIGKTVVAAAIAALARAHGRSVAIVKPGQTGVRGDDTGDVDVIKRLTGVTDAVELARYPEPISPAAAARVAGMPGLDLTQAAKQIAVLADEHDLVVVEGAGGLLVDYNDDHETIADLAKELSAPLVLVIRPDLGTLNHTKLTLEVMEHRGLHLSGVVIGMWPSQPDLSCKTNIEDLQDMIGRPLSGAIREDSGHLGKAEFLAVADAGLGPEYGGRFDAADFQSRFNWRKKS